VEQGSARDLDARVTRLECEVRRWRLAALVVPAALAAAALGGPALPTAGAKAVEPAPGRLPVGSGEVVAERFVLRDAGGTTRALLGPGPEGEPTLILLDRFGVSRAVIGPSQLSLSGIDGGTAARLLVTPGGAPALRLEKDGRLRAVLGMTADGTLALGFYGQDGTGRALLDVGKDGPPGLTLFHRSGKVAWSAP
jgi:hypothetical protein